MQLLVSSKAFARFSNMNTFLLDITIPIIEYLENSNVPFEAQFRETTKTNPPFYSEPQVYGDERDRRREELFTITDEFADSLLWLSEYVGCECHNKSLEQYDLELKDALKNYVEKIVTLWHKPDFDLLLATASNEFKQEFLQLSDQLEHKKCNFEQAEASLMYWKDAVSDDLLLGAILSLRLNYINSKLSLNRN